MESWQDWLIGEPGAVWITGTLLLVLTVVGLLLRWRRRERPPHVVIQEIESIRLLDIHPSQRNRLQVKYLDENGTSETVEDLRQKEIVIYNDGTRDILEPLELRLRFREPSSTDKPFDGFWRWFSDDNRCAATPLEDGEIIEPYRGGIRCRAIWGGLGLDLQYLNSYSTHGDYVAGHLISDGDLHIVLWGKVGGKGWSADFTSLQRLDQLNGRVRRTLSRASLSLVLFGMAVFFSQSLLSALFSPDILFGHIGMIVALLGVVLDSLGVTVAPRIVRRYLRIRPASEFERTSS